MTVPDNNPENKPFLIVEATDYSYVGRVAGAVPERRRYIIEYHSLKDLWSFAAIYMNLSTRRSTQYEIGVSTESSGGTSNVNKSSVYKDEGVDKESSDNIGSLDAGKGSSDEKSTNGNGPSDGSDDESSSSSNSIEESQNVFDMNALHPFKHK